MDKLMKQGKLYASDVLPRFAEVLNEMIPNVDTDNLVTSLNRLSNAFVDMVKNWGIEEKFKSVVDTVSRLLGVLANNAKAVFVGLKVLLTAGLANAVYRVLRSIGKGYDQFVATAVKAQETLKNRQEATARAQEAVDKASAAVVKAREAENVAAVEASEAQKQRLRTRTANAEAALAAKTTALVKAQEAEKAAAAKVTAQQQAAAAASGATAKLVATMKAAAMATLWTAAISAVMTLVGWLVKAVRETNRIKNIVSDMRKEQMKPIDLDSVDKLYRNRDIIFSRNSSKDAQAGALKQVNDLLGTSFKLADAAKGKASELNKEIERRVQLLQTEEKIRRTSEALQSKKEKLRELQGSEEYKDAKRWFPATYARQLSIGVKPEDIELPKLSPLYEERQLKQAIAELEFALQDATRIQAELNGRSSETSTNPPSFGDESGKKGKKTELEKQQESYTESLRALQKKLDVNIITQDEYDQALRELIEKSYVDAYASGDKAVLESDYYKALENSFRQLSRGEAYKAERQRAEMLKEHGEALRRAKAELAAGVISEQEYRDTLYDLTRELRKRMASNMSGTDDFEQAYFSGLGELTRGLAKPKLKSRDTSRDYKKTNVDILEESLSIAQQNRDIYRELAKETGGMFSAELREAMANVKTLEEALRIAEAKKAVEDLTKELHEGVYMGTKNIVGNVDNIVSAFERVGEALSDEDASAWERIMAVWEAMTSITDAFLQTIEMIERLTKVKEMLTKAEMAEAAVSDIVTDKKVANAAKGMAADAEETTSTVANAGTKVAAKTAEGAAAAGASAASLPFPWNLVAIGTAIAAALAAFAMIPRFEKGGIVGGNSPKGDKLLARLNSGEMVLNKNQQGTLYGLLSNRSSHVEVGGEFKLRGRDLVAVIDSNNKFKQRTK